MACGEVRRNANVNACSALDCFAARWSAGRFACRLSNDSIGEHNRSDLAERPATLLLVLVRRFDDDFGHHVGKWAMTSS